MWNKTLCVGVVCWAFCQVHAFGGGPVLPAGGTVRKTVETFDDAAWVLSPWNTGAGQLVRALEAAPDSSCQHSLELQARFSGQGFEGVAATPPQPIYIPGEAKTLTLRVKRSDARYGLKLGFRDGWGRESADGRRLEWDLRLGEAGKWQTYRFQVPENWVKPLAITACETHNWEAQRLENSARFWISLLEVETDLRKVDPVSGTLKNWQPEPRPANPAKALKEAPPTPLFSAEFASGAEAGVFAGEEPSVTIRLRNWLDGALTGQATFEVKDQQGQSASHQTVDVTVESAASYTVPLPVARFGCYQLKAALALTDGTRLGQEMALAKLPPLKPLTEAQKTASPYGLNVHSGDGVVIGPFKKAGLVWFREYAFSWDWILRAKGEDGRYAGWPFYPRMIQAYQDAGVRVVPVMQKSITAPALQNSKVVGRIGPDVHWSRTMANLILTFPQITHWELSNEYDLPKANARAEELTGWANYRAYHKQFSELISVLSLGQAVAVENGRAGIWPKRVGDCVKSGDFARLGVVNSHHYCGTDAPEANEANYNMGFVASEQQLGCFYDLLRAVKQAAQADGHKRESWLTEFGWDTLAGPLVSPYEQAVFLPRAWMLALAAGTDKAFWFYNFDAANPKTFFDGCGLLSAKHEPKLALCSLAGLTSILPTPRYVGSLEAGENTWGYVFENQGKLVASLWTIRGDKGPTVTFHAEQLYDYLGNRLNGDTVQLTMAPVYAVGLDRADIWFRQAAYSLKTPLLSGASGGDLVKAVLKIDNQRQSSINCTARLVLPNGWLVETTELTATVPPGGQPELEFPFMVAPLESQGIKEAKLIISENEKIKELPFRILVQPALTMQVTAISGAPGPGAATVKLANLSARPQNATLRFQVPSNWTVSTSAVPVTNLKPGEQREFNVALQWSADWKPNESASAVLDAGVGQPLVQPLIPSHYRLYAADRLPLDGDPGKWPAKCELPNWMLGATAGEAQARAWLAWTQDGLCGTVEVHNSKLRTQDPKSFWAGDVLELFVDTRCEKRARAYEPGDHHFWFVPLVEQNRAYVGRWKHDTEVGETRFDIQGVASVVKPTADGYIMQFLLPTKLLDHYHPVAGAKLGLSLNLTVQGNRSVREVYWPQPKSWGATSHPESWGTLELVD